MLLAVWMFTPLTNSSTPAPAQQRFISYNLYIHNPQVETDLNWIEKQSADVVFLTEAAPPCKSSSVYRPLIPMAASAWKTRHLA